MKAEDRWQSLIDEDRERWLGTVEEFRRTCFERLIRFGDRHLCNHLRPKFLTETEMARLERSAEAVMRGIVLAGARVMDDPELRRQMGFRPIEEEFIAPDPGFSHPAPCARLDSFITPDGPRFVELNGECPAGPGYSDRLADAFLEHPLAERFQAYRTLRKIDTLAPLLDTLLTCWAEFDGSRDPRVAIVDYLDVSTRFEFEIVRDYFRSRGVETEIVDPRHLEYDGKQLSSGGRVFDLVYKRVLMNEFIDRLDEVRPLFEAYRDGRICLVNPFRSKVVHKKAIFAVVTGDDRREWLDAETVAEIDRAVPWTRVLRDVRTRYHGEEVDLLAMLEERRETFVLKPNDDYGGKGITLGWEVSPEDWRRALRGALDRDFVVQERVTMIAEPFPAFAKDLRCDQLFVDLDPYLYLGQVHGALGRLGAGSLCNVTSGGGQVPVLIVPDRENSA
ncbi:MAG: hypothetical protein R3F20_08440 [Planctomycetota bacterium]